MDFMDRRHFAKISAMTLAATRMSAFAQSGSATRPVGFAAVGLGLISDIFMKACASSSKAKITGLVTGHPDEKGVKYAAEYGVPKGSVYTYETFDRIRDNKDIEAVYIGLPNSMHCEFTVRAAEAGKHVLCEKPMAISSAECRKMIDACKRANVKLMIAYRIQYEPMWNRIFTMLRSGELGQIEAFQGGFFGRQPAGAWRLNRKLAGGGSVLDLGIYPLNAIRWITGEEPSAYTAVSATRDHSGTFAEVEQSIMWTMKMPSGIIASCGSSYGASGPSFLTVDCERGTLDIRPAFNYDGIHLTGRTPSGPIDEVDPGKAPYQFTIEADHFADCVRNNTEPKTPGEEGLKDMLAIEAIYRVAGTPIA
jgi:predicted dehydrogenase